MNDIHQARVETITDRYMQSSYGLWNALLTINGIILAASSLTSSNFTITTITLVSALFSIGLLIHNYVVVKSTYFRIREMMDSNSEELTKEKKEEDIKLYLSRNFRIRLFEVMCLAILFLQAILIVSGYILKNA